MKTSSLSKTIFLGIAIMFSVANSFCQQLLNNISFEELKPGYSYPTTCLPGSSGSGGSSFFFPCTPADYFLFVKDWDSHYHIDNIEEECNETELLAYVHSPDWVGDNDDPLCADGWDQGFNVGLGAYEAVWQHLGDELDPSKCYEVRLKAQIFGSTTKHELNILLGTQQFYYQNDQLYFPSGGGCIYCDPNNGENFSEYIIAPSEQLIYMKEFPVSDLFSSLTYGAYDYNNWFEFHGKINLNQIIFNFPISNYVQFGLDVRQPNGMAPNCDSPYLMLDWIEFFESCPDHYDIYGTMIAGQQDEYVASNYIKAGYIDKGPAIVTNNGKTAFRATNYIELVPGFLSDYGSNLEVVPQSACSCPRIKISELDTHLTESSRDNSMVNSATLPQIQVNAVEQDCQIFPNPAKERITVTISNSSIFSLTLLNNNSQIIKSLDNINKSQMEIDISSLTSGVYYIIVQTTSNEKYFRKIIKL